MQNSANGPIRQFASDNRSGMCPEALQALIAANAGHSASYGDDTYSLRATELLRDLFEKDCAVYFVPTGTEGQFPMKYEDGTVGLMEVTGGRIGKAILLSGMTSGETNAGACGPRPPRPG